ncbi:MAG: superinfection immunity protein [Candidatus Obscuribacter sp.]|nr:superinfection immunity protein [Candidatus Obscuribacter sp.]MBK9278547.1 superinfection immunity protein [Candidatus Obscuribacter sp.]
MRKASWVTSSIVTISTLSGLPAQANELSEDVWTSASLPACVACVALLIFLLGLYLLPALIGAHKQKDNVVAIATLNVFLGWTGLGYLVSLLWALTNNGCKKPNKEIAGPLFNRFIALLCWSFVLFLGSLVIQLLIFAVLTVIHQVQLQQEETAKRKHAQEITQQLKEEFAKIPACSIYKSLHTDQERSQDPGCDETIEFYGDGKSFHYFYPATGIGFYGVYQIENGNQLKTWDEALPAKADQVYTIEGDRLIRTSDKQEFVRTGRDWKRLLSRSSGSTATELEIPTSSDNRQPPPEGNVIVAGNSKGTQSSTDFGEAHDNKNQLSQIQRLEENQLKATHLVEKLKSSISDLEKSSADKDREIDRLTKNLRLTRETIVSKDESVEEMRRQLDKWKKSANSETHRRKNTDQTLVQESISPLAANSWPGIREFYPLSYKQDLERRLKNVSLQRLAVPGQTESVEMNFKIERDGRPTDIECRSSNTDEKARERYCRFIQGAGPFRPILSDDIGELNVATTLTQSGNAPVEVTSLSIECHGNKL